MSENTISKIKIKDIEYALVDDGAVKYAEQTLTEDQKNQARANIDAQQTLTFDAEPTPESTNPVTSGGLFNKFATQDENIAMTSMVANMAMPGSLTWDGYVGDRECVIASEEQLDGGITMRLQYVHVSDYVPETLFLMMGEVPAEERIIPTLCSMTGAEFGGIHEVFETQAQVADDMFIMGEAFVYVPTDGYFLEGIAFPKMGWYLMSSICYMGDFEIPVMYISGLRLDAIVFHDNSGGDADKYFEDVKENVIEYVGDTLTWDGVIGDRYAIDVSTEDIVLCYVKVAEYTPAILDFININSCSATIRIVDGVSTEYDLRVVNNVDYQRIEMYLVGETSFPAVSIYPAPTSVANESGVYLLQIYGETGSFHTSSLTVPGYNFTVNQTVTREEVIKTEHLPKALQFGEIEKTVHGDTLTWDGNTAGLVAVVTGDGVNAYKISDNIPKAADFVSGGSITITYYSNGLTQTSTISDSFRNKFTDDGFAAWEVFLIVPTDNYTDETMVYPKSGIYVLASADAYVSSLTIPGYTGFPTTTTETVKVDPKYLHQPDWNQTDETAADFVKNRTHGDFLTVILEEQELPYSPDEEGCVGIMSASPQAGSIVSVVFDGEHYTCEVVATDMFVAFGNLGLFGMGEDTGEPFLAVIIDTIIVVLAMDEANHTVKVTAKVAKRLPDKYASVTKLYTNEELKYIYTDVQCTIKASIADIPDHSNYSIGVTIGGVVVRWVAPVRTESSAFSVSMGYCSVDCEVGASNMKTLYTAEYTG